MMGGTLRARGAFAAAASGAAGACLGFLFASWSDAGFVVLAAAAGMLLGALAGYLAFHGPDRTLAAVSAAANRVAGGSLGERVTVASPATGDLGRSFNHMATHVQDLVGSIEAEHARLAAVFEAVGDGMVAVSRNGAVTFANHAALRLLGWRGDAEGRPFIEIARDYELDTLVHRAIAAGGAAETRVITFGPARTPLRAAAMPIHDGGGWAVLIMLTDLTEVQRVDAMRRDFLSNVSHELRTPLASIHALVETIEAGNVEGEEETREFMARIRQQVDRVTALINELLDLSRIESGAAPLQPERLDLADLVAEAVSLLRPRWEPRRIAIAAPARPGPVVEADRPAVLRVVSNLLDNAIKYSPEGGRIEVGLHDEGELAALEVRDEGQGIAVADLPRVFERFYKGDASRATAGAGLGLAIVKHIVRAHGGTVSAASPHGGGATFTVRLPKAFVAQRRPPAAIEPAGSAFAGPA
jgi:two-component system phosphate regulon sensor histidine kinase PhoR